MKKLSLTLGLLAFCLKISIAQVCTISELNYLFEQAETNNKLKIERIAAIEFHKLLNQYLESNGLNALMFNETLWIASRNHCEYMRERKVLTHTEARGDKKSKVFTGQDPGDRYNFASGENAEYGWSDENALYNFSGKGDDFEQIALDIAKQSLEQWKNSPGHNANMLGNHTFEETAFIITYGRVWGTSLFARGERKERIEEPIYVNKSNNKPIASKSLKFNAFKTQTSILETLLTKLTTQLNFKVKQHNKLSDEARFVARNLLNKKFTKESDNPIVYTQKETTTSGGFLGFFTKEISTYTLVIEKELNSFNEDDISDTLAEMVQANQSINTKSNLGLGVAIKKSKKTIRVSLVSVVS